MTSPARGSFVRRAVHRLTDEGRAEAAGHTTEQVVEWFDMDDSAGHVTCTCGWRTRSVKVCWLADMAADHHRMVLGKSRLMVPR